MTEEGYEEMRVLPEIDPFSSNPVLKRYRGRAPGNSPELFNIDSCLHEYFHKAVDYHIRYTHSLHKLYPICLSTATPKKGTSAYLRIFDTIDVVVPSSAGVSNCVFLGGSF